MNQGAHCSLKTLPRNSIADPNPVLLVEFTPGPWIAAIAIGLLVFLNPIPVTGGTNKMLHWLSPCQARMFQKATLTIGYWSV